MIQKISKIKKVSVSVHVLTGNAWPLGQGEPNSFKPPVFLQDVMNAFGEFYLGKYKGRMVSYRHSIGRADMLMRFEKIRPLTFAFTNFVLLIFNFLKIKIKIKIVYL